MELWTDRAMKKAVLWDVTTPYSFCKNRRFGGTYCLHVQDEKLWVALVRLLALLRPSSGTSSLGSKGTHNCFTLKLDAIFSSETLVPTRTALSSYTLEDSILGCYRRGNIRFCREVIDRIWDSFVSLELAVLISECLLRFHHHEATLSHLSEAADLGCLSFQAKHNFSWDTIGWIDRSNKSKDFWGIATLLPKLGTSLCTLAIYKPTLLPPLLSASSILNSILAWFLIWYFFAACVGC
jgi:hypothetical protein